MTHNRVLEITTKLGMRPLGQQSREGWLCFPCPFAPYLHPKGTDNNPSFFVHVDNTGLSGFNCYTCKKHGRISTLVRELCSPRFRDVPTNGLDITADLYETPDEFIGYEDLRTLETEELEPLNAAAYVGMYPSAWDDPVARAYVISRGIGPDTVQVLGMLFDPDEQRIVFPVYDAEMNLYGFTGRTIHEPEQYPYERYGKIKDYHGLKKQHLLLGEQLVDPTKPMWVVEGLFALARSVEIGARKRVNPVGTLGSRLYELQRDRLAGYNNPVYMAYDLDAAGDDGLYGSRVAKDSDMRRDDGAIKMLTGHCPVFVPPYPHDISDIDKLRNLADIDMMLHHAECVA